MKSKRLTALLLTVLLGCYGFAVQAGSVPEGNDGPVSDQQVVNINTADADQLEKVLDGVGRSRAEAIVAFREANGRFYSAEELAAVRGIGKSTVEKNETRIIVE